MPIKDYDELTTEALARNVANMVNLFWSHGGMKKWDDMVKVNPDKNFNQWVSAYLMDLIDQSKITIEK